MRNNAKGFGAVEIVLIIAAIGLLGVVSWLFFSKYEDAKNSENTATTSDQAQSTEKSKNTQESVKEMSKATIYPDVGTSTGANGMSKDLFYTVELPVDWAVRKVYGDYDIVKFINDDNNEGYLISSSIEHNGGPNSNRNLMKQRVAEGVEIVSSFKTSSGTDVSVMKTPFVLFLGSCKPTGENCYLDLSGKQLYIHLYHIYPGAMNTVETEFPQDIIDDFESIARSLSI